MTFAAVKAYTSLTWVTNVTLSYFLLHKTAMFWVVGRALLCGYGIHFCFTSHSSTLVVFFPRSTQRFSIRFSLFYVSPIHSSLARLIIALRWLWPFQWHSTIRLLSHCQCSRAVIYEVTSQKWTLAIMYFPVTQVSHTIAKASARTHAHSAC